MTSQAAKAYQAVSARQARDALILAHLPMVRHNVGRLIAHLPPGIDVENLESAGTLGLVEAANRFDPERGIKFEVFAALRIRGAVYDELRRNCPLPQQILERIAIVRKAYKDLPPPVSVETLSAKTNLSVEVVTDCLTAMRMTRMISWESLSEPRQAQVTGPAPEDAINADEQRQQLAGALMQMPERDRLVVTLHYLQGLRLREIGAVMELSESRVSRLLSAALYNLGEYLRTQNKE